MKIVVLAGGISTERDVSIVSGAMVCKALREKAHQAILLDAFFGEADADMDNLFSASYDVDRKIAEIKSFNGQMAETIRVRKEFFGPHVIDICKTADIVFLALHGECGEDGKVQAAFDLFGIKYTGSGYLSSAIAMDKYLSKKLLGAADIPCPKGISIKKAAYLAGQGAGCGSFPVVVKPCCGGSSVGVFIAADQEEYETALQAAFAYENEVVVEDYICGREFSVGVVDHQALPVIEIEPVEGFYNYENKYQQGAAVETCPARLSAAQTERMQDYAVRGAQALLIEGYSRLDFMMDETGNMYCLEANTLPGMTATSLLPQEAAAVGINYPDLCEKLIEVSLKKYQLCERQAGK